jgi:hypothetical protein
LSANGWQGIAQGEGQEVLDLLSAGIDGAHLAPGPEQTPLMAGSGAVGSKELAEMFDAHNAAHPNTTAADRIDGSGRRPGQEHDTGNPV